MTHKIRLKFSWSSFLRFVSVHCFVLWSAVSFSTETLRVRSSESICQANYTALDRSLAGNVPLCPAAQGTQILPNHYPPASVFVGVSAIPEQIELLEVLLDEAARHEPPLLVNVLLPNKEIEKLSKKVQKFLSPTQARYINFIQTTSPETIWVQDYFEVGVNMKDQSRSLIDLFYKKGFGDEIPTTLSLSCQIPIVGKVSKVQNEVRLHAGNFGGNIEAYPGSLLLVGDNMAATTKSVLAKNLGMQQYQVNVSWLATGHVDEVFSVVPDQSSKAPCNFAILRASPKRAFEILKNSPVRLPNYVSPVFPGDFEDEEVKKSYHQERDLVHFCLSLADKYISKELTGFPLRCLRFFETNDEYEEIIRKDHSGLLAKIRAKTGCKKIRSVLLPVLFKDDDFMLEGRYAASALNPNSVNGILFSKRIILPKQPYEAFQKDIDASIRSLGLTPRYVNSGLIHHLQGGLHCLTNIVRSCRPIK